MLTVLSLTVKTCMICVCPDVSAMANLYSTWATSSVIGLHNYLSVVQVILPEIAEYDVMVQIKACGLSRIDTKVNNLSPSTDNITFSIQYSLSLFADPL